MALYLPFSDVAPHTIKRSFLPKPMESIISKPAALSAGRMLSRSIVEVYTIALLRSSLSTNSSPALLPSMLPVKNSQFTVLSGSSMLRSGSILWSTSISSLLCLRPSPTKQ